MSHEGFRFVSNEEAARAEQPRLTGDAIRPAKVKSDTAAVASLTFHRSICSPTRTSSHAAPAGSLPRLRSQ